MAPDVRAAMSAPRRLLAALPALLLLLPAAPRAEVLSARVAVRGMTCTLCSGSVERRLRRLSFVERATVDLDRGLADLALRPGVTFEGRRVLQSIRSAGFTPGDIEVVARGTLVRQGRDPYLEVAPGKLVLLTGDTDEGWTGGPPGGLVQVTGRFADPSGDARAEVAITVTHGALASRP